MGAHFEAPEGHSYSALMAPSKKNEKSLGAMILDEKKAVFCAISK